LVTNLDQRRQGQTPRRRTAFASNGKVVQSAGILRVQTTCPTCAGNGQVITDPCRECSGHGFIGKRVSLDVTIPAGVDDGMRVRIPGEGEPSPEGGAAGDLYCFVVLEEHPLFAREGMHLLLEFPITYAQAALGATLEIPTLNGREELKIPAATQSGEVFRLRGCGVRDPRGRGVGDLHVQTHIEVPRKLSQRQEELLRELAEEEKTNVSPHRKSFFAKLKDYFVSSSDAEE
jgi:molecular chaperone DnaJ